VLFKILSCGPSRDEAKEELLRFFPNRTELSETYWGNAPYAVLVDDEPQRTAEIFYLFLSEKYEISPDPFAPESF
jgi:hypothetical protein